MSSKKPISTKKQTQKTSKITHQPRRLMLPKRIWYKPLTWRHRPPVPAYKPLPKARVVFWAVLRQLWANKKLFMGIVLIYGVLNLLLVWGFAGSSDLSSLKQEFDAVLHGHGIGGELTSSLATYVTLLTSSGSGDTATSGLYQAILLIVCSLAFIWALRQTLAKHVVSIKDSFYQGMYPLVPFVLSFILLGLQLLPLAIGEGLYALTTSSGIAIHLWEKLACLVVFIILALWSLRMLTASLFALYIVTLPDMTPLRAYRSARQLVYGRRLLLWRKLIFLPVVLLLLSVVIELPLILFVTPVAVWVFFVLSTVALPIVHGYLYNFYREML